MLDNTLPYIDDQEGTTVPHKLPKVIDAHVHVFPDKIFAAVWGWFDEHAWRIRYRLAADDVLRFSLSRGVTHVVALQYAHKPGIARELNAYMAKQCKENKGRVTGLATVLPGEPDAVDILQEGFDMGLGGLKLHAHVQCFDMSADYMQPLYECCQTNGKPIVTHVGREPKSPAYRCDPYLLCGADRCERILKDFPRLKICVPHLGIDETSTYRNLIEKYDNLWLDTAMAITDYFFEDKISLKDYRSDRIMYGSDFPNLPYAWDRELKALIDNDLDPETLQQIAYKNALEFFDIKL